MNEPNMRTLWQTSECPASGSSIFAVTVATAAAAAATSLWFVHIYYINFANPVRMTNDATLHWMYPYFIYMYIYIIWIYGSWCLVVRATLTYGNKQKKIK